jgi:hypothetical protein
VTAYDFGANGSYDQPEGHESWFANEQVPVIGDPPGSFGKIQPLPGAASQPLSLTLSWGTSSGVERYEYCYDTSNDGACSIWLNNGMATSAYLVGLTPGTTCYWHVRAVNDSGVTYSDGAGTAFWSFTTGSLPGGFSKSSPTNGSTSRPLDQRIAWAPSSGADYYESCYDTSNDNACSSWINNGTAYNVNLSGLSPGTTYYWHARAVNSCGMTYSNGNSSAFWSFTTGTLPGAFGKSSPADGATNQLLTVTLGWTASNSASSYEYCHDTTDDDACSAWSSTGAATSVELAGLLPGTAYYWHVRAVNGFGVTYAEGSGTASGGSVPVISSGYSSRLW